MSETVAGRYNYFRDYDPSIGRYIESDPIGLDASLNTFAYVDGNPLSLLDALGLDANTLTYGEIRAWAINSQRDFRPPPGLADAKASINGACTRNPAPNSCNEADGTKATAPGDRAAWSNIVNATGGADLSGGGSFMCVGTQNCWFVHSCYKCKGCRKTLTPRTTPLAPSGTATVGRHTLYFYDDPLGGWGSARDRQSGCRCGTP